MAKIPMPEEMIRNVAESVLDVEIDGKTLREWIGILKEYPSFDWISAKDRLPEDEKEVLCYLGNALGKGIVVAFRRHGDWYFDGWKCPTVTHWMPLPEPPKEE